MPDPNARRILVHITGRWISASEKQRSRLESLVNNAPALIYLKNNTGEIEISNTEYTQITHQYSNSSHAHSASPLSDIENETITHKKVRSQEYTLKDFQGSELTYHAYYFPVLTKNKITGVGAIILDISE